ncbi:hypothetical protein niasHT_014162 [Heterodera trifolii]|uniref:Galectin domain-containing protein n=1 Tax=Heterodera trifolii TaxID=157864 RepID=A0ABD2KWY3_9BILA
MRILLNIPLILCLFFALNGIQSSADGKITKPTRLTGHGTKVTTIQIQDFDQCFPRDATKTFGLEFRLPRDGGCCEDGLIICYPSIMATGVLDNYHTLDTVDLSNEMFNIDNMDNSPIAEECQNRAKKLGNSMAKLTWHGISIKLNRKSDGISTAILETSFCEKRYIVPDVFRQFNIHFGNKSHFAAYITIDEEMIDIEDGKVAQYKKMALIGAKIRDFLGFWVLGLDMIPWDEQTMKLFVIRHCNCSLEAFFLRPSDSEPTDPEEASMGTGRFEDRCVNETQKLTMPIHISDVNQVITIRLLTNKMKNDNSMNNTIALKLWHTDIEMLSIHFFLANNTVEVMIGTEKHFCDYKFSNEIFEMNLQIWLKQYSYKILFKNKRLGKREYYPEKWWQGLKFKDHNKLTLDGHYALIDDPRVFPSQAEDELSTTVSYYSYVPWSEKLNLRVRIKLLDGDTTHFKIFLLHDSIEPVNLMGATVMQLEVTVTKENVATIELSEFLKNEKKPMPEDSKMIENEFKKLFKNGEQRTFEFQTVLKNEVLNVIINNVTVQTNQKRELPAWAANYIRLEGNVTAFGEPDYLYIDQLSGKMKIISGKIENTDPNEIFLVKTKIFSGIKIPDDFTIKLPTLFNYGDSVELFAKREKVAKQKNNNFNNFTFIFMHESLDENSMIGDTLLKLEYAFVSEKPNFRKEVKCSYHLNMNNRRNASVQPHGLSEFGGIFILEISAGDDRFVINVFNEVNAPKLECLYPNNTLNGQNVTIPPWAVDHIRIRGNDHFGQMSFEFIPNKQNESKRITALKQINATNGVGFLETGDRINVVVQRNASKISTSSMNVSFLNEALAFNKIIGKTIMKAEVLNEQLTLSHYINGKPGGTKNCAAVKLTETYKFEFIAVSNNAFNVSVNEVKDSCGLRPNSLNSRTAGKLGSRLMNRDSPKHDDVPNFVAHHPCGPQFIGICLMRFTKLLTDDLQFLT